MIFNMIPLPQTTQILDKNCKHFMQTLRTILLATRQMSFESHDNYIKQEVKPLHIN